MSSAASTLKFWSMRLLAPLAFVALAACSGGKSTESQQNTNNTNTGVAYTGPAPANADVQAFKNELWANVVSTCGNCHKTGGSASPAFATTEDINVAYNAALQVVNLSAPDQSRVVTKVGGGHNCWSSSPQACADNLTTWITNWAIASGVGNNTGTQIRLVDPSNYEKDLTGTSVKTFPSDTSLFSTTVYPLLTQYCSRCHASTATTPQKPYFASADVNEAYSEAKPKINLDTVTLSRLYVRLKDESHNCWSDCTSNAGTMYSALLAFANGSPNVVIDPTLTISKALKMYDGTVASGGNRYEQNQIARYYFKEGSGVTAYDTSGVTPYANLTLDKATFAGGWGINITDGAKASVMGTEGNAKFINRIANGSGEFTIEAWIAPANVAQDDAFIVGDAGSKDSTNFALVQKEYQYQARVRNSATDSNGMPALLTNDADRDAQASLQHVVLTYDPVNGRRFYVNGVFTGDADTVGGGNLDNWDSAFAFAVGNAPGGGAQWTGLMKFLAVHDRALTAGQALQNFNAGVGERYYVLFNVSSLTGIAQSYVMFEVSQYDSYAYLFNRPTFISLDPNALPGSLRIKGIRIGVNGNEAKVGQAYIPLDVTVTNANYNADTGQLLGNVGTIIALEKGPMSDLFFLSFEQIGSVTSTHDYSDKTVVATVTPVDQVRPDVGYRTFDKIDASFAKITGVARTTTNVRNTFNLVKQQLPAVENIDGFVSANQIGIAQLGGAYCSALLDSTTLTSSFFGAGLNVSNDITAQRDALIDPLLTKAMGTGLSSQPQASGVKTELNALIDDLCAGNTCTNGASRNKIVAKAVCVATLSSAVTTIH